MNQHAWDVPPKRAIEIQQQLRTQVRLQPLDREVRFIAGADVSMNLYSNVLYAGFAVMSWPDLAPVDHAVVEDVTKFPYVPGLLSFREIPALLKAWAKLTTKPDLVVVDGMGIAHPRRLGIASHLGVMLDVPALGCGKSILTGICREPDSRAGSQSPLTDRSTGEVIGMALRTKARANPVYISPGHLITLDESVAIVSACLRGYRLPEPTRRAHELVNDFRRRALGSETDRANVA
ncbi:MAG: deoxyribonuclease V [Rariglobus sp.]